MPDITHARAPRRFTSLRRCQNGNFQIDEEGTLEECVTRLEEWCREHNAIWAHMFSEDGTMVASFTREEGAMIRILRIRGVPAAAAR